MGFQCVRFSFQTVRKVNKDTRKRREKSRKSVQQWTKKPFYLLQCVFHSCEWGCAVGMSPKVFAGLITNNRVRQIDKQTKRTIFNCTPIHTHSHKWATRRTPDRTSIDMWPHQYRTIIYLSELLESAIMYFSFLAEVLSCSSPCRLIPNVFLWNYYNANRLVHMYYGFLFALCAPFVCVCSLQVGMNRMASVPEWWTVRTQGMVVMVVRKLIEH